MLWEIDIYPAPGQPDRLAQQVAADARDLGFARNLNVTAANGYLIQGPLDEKQIRQLADELFVDRVVERAVVGRVGSEALSRPPRERDTLAHVLPKPGVMDPVAQSAQAAIADLGLSVDAVRTLRKFWLADFPEDKLPALASKVLANDAIEQVIVGPLKFDRLETGSTYNFTLIEVPLRSMDDAGLEKL